MLPRSGTRRMLTRFRPTISRISLPKVRSAGARAAGVQDQCIPFTSAFTRFPDYAGFVLASPVLANHAALPVEPRRAGVHAERRALELANHGITQSALWSRGIDGTVFHRDCAAEALADCRVTCSTSAAWRSRRSWRVPRRRSARDEGGGRQWPDLARAARELSRGAFPEAVFVRPRAGLLLGRCLRGVRARPIRSASVMIEAMACGLPVARAVPVPGPDAVAWAVLGPQQLAKPVGALHDDLALAIAPCLRRRLRPMAGVSWRAQPTSSSRR